MTAREKHLIIEAMRLLGARKSARKAESSRFNGTLANMTPEERVKKIMRRAITMATGGGLKCRSVSALVSRLSFSEQLRTCNADGTCQHMSKATDCFGPRGPLFCGASPGVCSSVHCPKRESANDQAERR